MNIFNLISITATAKFRLHGEYQVWLRHFDIEEFAERC